MDYKKKYNEALRWMRDVYPALTGSAKEDAEHYFPELKESEGERIRKAIESIIRVYGKTQGEWIAGYDMDTLVVHLRDAFAYLEKQKEPNYTKRNALFDKCVENCDPEIMKRVSDKIDAELQKEQEPVNPSDDELQRHQDELYDFKVFATKQAREHHISFVHDFEWNNFCAELLSYFAEQKPAEWSEEDKEIYNSFKVFCQKLIENKKETFEADPYYAQKMLAWLKSLRPQSKEELEKKLREMYNKGYKDAEEYHYMIEVSYWKPSEEQMTDLFIAAREGCEAGSPTSNTLKTLYKDLEKL